MNDNFKILDEILTDTNEQIEDNEIADEIECEINRWLEAILIFWLRRL